jgi:hypothetical protein
MGASGTMATGGTGAAGTAAAGCDATSCGANSCCDGMCRNLQNDFTNCGICGTVCPGPNPYCDKGACAMAPCLAGTKCGPGTSCCGLRCCEAGQICCTIPGPMETLPTCIAPGATGSCPI